MNQSPPPPHDIPVFDWKMEADARACRGASWDCMEAEYSGTAVASASAPYDHLSRLLPLGTTASNGPAPSLGEASPSRKRGAEDEVAPESPKRRKLTGADEDWLQFLQFSPSPAPVSTGSVADRVDENEPPLPSPRKRKSRADDDDDDQLPPSPKRRMADRADENDPPLRRSSQRRTDENGPPVRRPSLKRSADDGDDDVLPLSTKRQRVN